MTEKLDRYQIRKRSIPANRATRRGWPKTGESTSRPRGDAAKAEARNPKRERINRWRHDWVRQRQGAALRVLRPSLPPSKRQRVRRREGPQRRPADALHARWLTAAAALAPGPCAGCASMGDSGVEARHRAKVYCLNEDGQWDDRAQAISSIREKSTNLGRHLPCA